VRLSGRWALGDGVPAADGIVRDLERGAARIALEASGLEGWDSSLVTFAHAVAAAAAGRGVAFDGSGLPEGRAACSTSLSR